MPLYGFLENSARKFPGRVGALYVGNGVTYSTLWRRATRFAGYLKSLGVEKGDRVGLLLANTPQYIIAFNGILAAGGVVQGMVTNRSGIALFPQLPPGPIQGTIKYLTFSQSFQSSTVSSHVIYATASLSYPLLATILGVASVAFYFIVRSIQGRSRFDGPGYRLP